MTWITAKNKPPLKHYDYDLGGFSEPVLVTYIGFHTGSPHTSDQTAVYCDDGEWYWKTEGSDFERAKVEIVAWMFLPQPYDSTGAQEDSPETIVVELSPHTLRELRKMLK